MKKAKSTKKGVCSSSKKEKPTILKKDLKIALVAKRLSMLQDDHHEGEIHPLALLTPEIVQCESTKPSKDINTSTDTLFESEDVEIPKSSKNRKKFGSHKRARVMSDDDESSEEDRALTSDDDDKYFKGRALMVRASSQKKGSQKMDLIAPLLSDKLPSMKRAKEVQANLSADYPNFVKLMLKSHVSGGYWLGLPRKFCDKHLPVCDSTMALVDEAGKESSTNYLALKTGLSGGWRGFSIDHNLVVGDALVFQLISPTKFQIYIVREQAYGEVDGALGLLNLDSGVEQQKSEDNSLKALQTEDNCTFADHLSQSNSDAELGPEVLNGICFTDSEINFDGVKGFEDFHIVVDGLIIDSKFPDNTRKKYYELCNSQKSFLHENFLKGLNCNLVVGTISEIINIADAINSCTASISHEDLQTWEKTLKSFELLGMKVDFLCARINQLLGTAVEADESNKLKENIIKRAFVGERMKALELKLTQLKETMENIDSEMDAEITKARAWKQETSFKEITVV